jgi:hypothetical protein
MADGSHFEPTSAALSWLNRLTTDLCPCILDVGLKLGGLCAAFSFSPLVNVATNQIAREELLKWPK